MPKCTAIKSARTIWWLTYNKRLLLLCCFARQTSIKSLPLLLSVTTRFTSCDRFLRIQNVPEQNPINKQQQRKHQRFLGRLSTEAQSHVHNHVWTKWWLNEGRKQQVQHAIHSKLVRMAALKSHRRRTGPGGDRNSLFLIGWQTGGLYSLLLGRKRDYLGIVV